MNNYEPIRWINNNLTEYKITDYLDAEFISNEDGTSTAYHLGKFISDYCVSHGYDEDECFNNIDIFELNSVLCEFSSSIYIHTENSILLGGTDIETDTVLYGVKALLDSFEGSRLLTDHNRFEFLAEEKSNTYFILSNCSSRLDVDCKVLEYLSRSACKTEPFYSIAKNMAFQKKIRDGINTYFGTEFTQEQMMEIYTYLGNGINREKTLSFIESNFDFDILSGKNEEIDR